MCKWSHCLPGPSVAGTAKNFRGEGNFSSYKNEWERTLLQNRAFDKIISYRKPCYIKYKNHPSSDTRPTLQSPLKIRILKTHSKIKKQPRESPSFGSLLLH